MLDSLHLAREEVSCYYKYITWVDDDTYRIEEVSELNDERLGNMMTVSRRS